VTGIRKSERGSAVYEMAVVITLMAILISGLFSLGPFVHLSFATRQTAYDCAVAAAQTLDERQGRMQGEVAGKMTAASFSMLTGNISFEVAGNWARNGQVACTATYHIPRGAFPMKMIIQLPSSYSYTVRLPIQIWHSTWR
jgi:Flp pilus assembly protein TadG